MWIDWSCSMMVYKNDDIVIGKVTGIESYGIFLSFDDNYTGLIHISEISDSFVRNINDYATISEEICAKVIGVDDDNKKLKLSLIGVNYRQKNNLKKGIIETKSGFSTLKNELNDWISNKFEKK
jgi:predicted RNA-binding protein with RPS1 domain